MKRAYAYCYVLLRKAENVAEENIKLGKEININFKRKEFGRKSFTD